MLMLSSVGPASRFGKPRVDESVRFVGSGRNTAVCIWGVSSSSRQRMSDGENEGCIVERTKDGLSREC